MEIEDLLKLEDAFENEFALPFLVKEQPREIAVVDLINSKEKIETLLREKYILFIQIPSFPIYKHLIGSEVLVENEYFKLLQVDHSIYNDHIWALLYENEYNASWCFFLMKDLAQIKINLPNSSSKRLLIERIENNEIYYIRLEINEMTICKWD